MAARERKLEAEAASKKHVRNGSTPSATSTTPNGTILGAHDKAVKKPVDWEIPRKTLHSSIGFFTIYLYTSHGSPQYVIVALSTALAVLIPIDFLRLRYPSFELAFEKCVGMFMRDSEKKSSNGVIWYILGVNAVLSTLPLDIAVVSILILSWADTAASTFGRLYGRFTPPLPQHLFGFIPLAPRKSLAGFIAASMTAAAVATGFWTFIGPMRDSGLTWSWEGGVSPAFSGSGSGNGSSSTMFAGWVGIVTIGVVTGLVSGVAEALDLGSVDDNLSLPIISGGCLWGLFKVIGWFGGLFA
jgi:diacylglycerol kinase (CTP)